MSLPICTPDGTQFQLWAPQRQSVAIQCADATYPLAAEEEGEFRGVVPLSPGDRYRVLLDSHLARPDPCSRFQPEGVHGPSAIIDPLAFRWHDDEWTGISRSELVVYEVHVGAFTEEGTYASARNKLDHVLELGATAIELLPLAQTPGRWNWGYDGVDLFAPNHRYGHPDELREFVDTCHQRGLAVLLDVVYNHLGPEGNYLADFGPYFSRNHRTPWGPALNYDGPQCRRVREYVIENALYWLREFHFDGLRIDAIRLMQDDSDRPIASELAAAVRDFAAGRSHPIHLIAEANIHDQALMDPPPDGSGYDLLWNDEIPHAFFSATLGQHQIDTRIYQGTADLRRTLDTGYVFERHRNGRDILRSESHPRTDLDSILQGLQTHDQIGNHPEGHRFHQIGSHRLQRVAAALVLLHPAIPLCFMGEEFAASTPFCFFVDFEDERLRTSVVEGRKRDYAHYNWETFLSPVEAETFHRSRLGPVAEGDPGMLAWYTALVALRKDWRADGILLADHLTVEHDEARQLFTLSYLSTHRVRANLGTERAQLPADADIQLHSEDPRFAGSGSPEDSSHELPAVSAAVYRLPA